MKNLPDISSPPKNYNVAILTNQNVIVSLHPTEDEAESVKSFYPARMNLHVKTLAF